MTNDPLAKHIQRMAAKASDTKAGRKGIERKIAANEKPVAPAQPLSEIEERKYIIPPTYLNRYYQLLDTDPIAAQAWWDRHKIAVKTDVEKALDATQRKNGEKVRKALEALIRVQSGNKLKRRI